MVLFASSYHHGRKLNAVPESEENHLALVTNWVTLLPLLALDHAILADLFIPLLALRELCCIVIYKLLPVQLVAQ
jgi:hypothetical protein